MTVLHQSDARIAIDCLARYKAERIDGADNGGIFAWIGSACHAGVEQGYIGTATGDRDPLDCALEGMEFWCQQRPELPARVRLEAGKILRFAYSEESSLWLRLPGRGQRVVVEQQWAMDAEFNAVPPDHPEIAYAGTIDVCEWGPEGIHLKDHKTSQVRISNEDLATDLQGWLYSLWALSNFNAPEVTWSLNMLRFGYSARTTFRKGAPWEAAAKRLFSSLRAKVMRAASDAEWPATPGLGCQYCKVAHHCEEFNALTEVGAERDDEPIETTAARYLAMKKRHAADERKLKAHVEDQIEIDIGDGRVLGFQPYTPTEWAFPLIDLIAQFRADGLEDAELRSLFPGGSVTKKAAEKAAALLVKRGDLDQAAHEYVEALRRPKPSTKFKPYIPVPEEETTP